MYEGLVSAFIPMIPLMSALLVLYLASFAYVQNKQSRTNQIFAMLCVSIAIWMFGTFMQFTITSYAGNIFWGRFIYIGVVFIPALAYHFALTISKKTGKLQKQIPIAYTISAVFLIASRFDLFAGGLYIYDWGVHIKANVLHHAFVFTYAYFMVMTYAILINYMRTLGEGEEREKVKYLLAAFGALSFAVVDFMPAYGVDVRVPLFYLFGAIFAMIITRAIVRYNFLHTRVLTTQILSTLVLFALTIKLFFVKTFTDFLLEGILLVIVSVLNHLLIKSVKTEIKQKEKLKSTTDRLRKATNELSEANKRLKRLDVAKTEFLSITSHQLRTPLSGIKGYVAMMLDGDFGKFGKKQSDILIRVKDEVERLIRLVQVFLDVSRIESGRLTISKSDFDLANLARNVIDELLPSAQSKKVSVKLTNSSKEKFNISADKDKLKDVMVNLVDNAIKYTPEGSVLVTLYSKNGKTGFEVRDSGVGMEPDEVSRVFEKFARGKGIDRISTSGSGLGLFIAKKIVESHKGKIWAESEGKGKGSVFVFEIPKR